MFKLFFFKIFILFFLTKSYAELIQNRSFECETSVVLSIDKKGELKQFLPGKIYFEISKNTITHQLNFYSVENNNFKKIF